ncbi:MAG: hypothetical protein IKI25_08525, partial [Bacteroidales bacterium]|nr:hypothetical protein [Bacteroidales bacterium]
MDNIFNNNSNGQQANITGNQGNVEINFCPKQIIDFKISYPENLIPRRDMLDKLSNEFESHKCVLISGIGGSGKTSLAYFYAKEKQFKNVAWVTVNGKIEDAYLERMAWDLFEGENLERFIHSTNQQAKLHKVTSILSSINGKSLLVLDINTNNEEIKLEIENKLHNYLPAGDWKTLVLTRTLPKNKSRFVTIEMDKMAENDAKILFSNNYDGYVELNDEQLAIIVKELYYHPLLVEQTAIVLSDGDEDT